MNPATATAAWLPDFPSLYSAFYEYREAEVGMHAVAISAAQSVRRALSCRPAIAQ